MYHTSKQTKDSVISKWSLIYFRIPNGSSRIIFHPLRLVQRPFVALQSAVSVPWGAPCPSRLQQQASGVEGKGGTQRTMWCPLPLSASLGGAGRVEQLVCSKSQFKPPTSRPRGSSIVDWLCDGEDRKSTRLNSSHL